MSSPTTHTPHSTRSVRSYVYGFILSLVLTFAAFWLSPLFGRFAAAVIVLIALLQLFVQMVFFLHLGNKQAPTWHRSLFAFALGVAAILIGGTLWIMHNLARLHQHAPGINDLYEHGVVAPQNELR